MTLPSPIISYKDCIHAQTKTHLRTTAAQFSTDSLFISVCVTGSKDLRKKYTFGLNLGASRKRYSRSQLRADCVTLAGRRNARDRFAPRLVLIQRQKPTHEWPNEI